MRKLMSRIATAALSVAMVLTTMAPAGAMQVPRVEAGAQSNVIGVRDDGRHMWPRGGGHHGGWGGPGRGGWGGPGRGGWDGPRRGGWDGPRRHWGGGWDGGRRHWRGGWDGPRRHGWYGGHRGYRYYRPGYRYYDGFWFPLAAFGAGAIIGGAMAAPPRPVYSGSMSPSHVSWCQNRWRSYRAYDNTYQPYSGPRRACVSPYS